MLNKEYWECVRFTWGAYGEESRLVPDYEERGDGQVDGRGPGGGDVGGRPVLDEAQGDVVHPYLKSEEEENEVRRAFSSRGSDYIKL